MASKKQARKKIILILSPYKPGQKEVNYSTPGGGPAVSGTQTNEAPVKYLLREHKEVDGIICVVTSEARKGAWEYFQEKIAAVRPDMKFFEVTFAEGQKFGSETLDKIMEYVSEGDEILLETTGGFRNAILYLLLASRALSYRGIPTVGAVYSNLNAEKIEDCTPTVELFDLIGGMQEMTSFGSVYTLRQYYQKYKPEPEVRALLDAMERLYEDITLCRTRQIEKRIDAVNSAMEQAENCSDLMIRTLLPAFRNKFDRKLTVPGLIKWCIGNGMVPQALTMYKEWIPNYILKRNALTVKKDAPALENLKEYEVEDDVRFYKLLTLPMLKDTERLFRQSDFEKAPWPTYSKLQDILMDYAYIRLLRNKVNHASAQYTQAQEALINYLSESKPNIYMRPENVKIRNVQRALEHGLENLKTC